MELTKEQKEQVISGIKDVVDTIYGVFANLMKDPNDVYDLAGIKKVLDLFKDTCENIDEKIIEKLS